MSFGAARLQTAKVAIGSVIRSWGAGSRDEQWHSAEVHARGMESSAYVWLDYACAASKVRADCPSVLFILTVSETVLMLLAN